MTVQARLADQKLDPAAEAAGYGIDPFAHRHQTVAGPGIGGTPVSPFDIHKADFHIAGSDASGIVWAVGRKVKQWQVGDEVVIHCNQDDGDDEECNGGDPMFSPSQRILGI